MEQYVGEIRLVGFNFAPVGWLLCNGQLLPISQYETLYVLLGTTYGGDGQTTFALPNLSSRVPLGQGNYQGTSYPLGMSSGVESVTLNSNQTPVHTHTIGAQTANPSSNNPSGLTFSGNSTTEQYEPLPANATTATMLAPAGQSQPHSNLMPLQAINYIVATEGIYPSTT